MLSEVRKGKAHILATVIPNFPKAHRQGMNYENDFFKFTFLGKFHRDLFLPPVGWSPQNGGGLVRESSQNAQTIQV